MTQQHVFQAEIKQLLNILAYSLYKDREIFLRELISNASDALHRLQFEMLTNQEILDPDLEMMIHLTVDEENKIIRVFDTGIGMTADEMVEHLGVIARSGARQFLDTLQEVEGSGITADIIGQFGVGFYSAFMVADQIEVISRSYRPDAEAARWVSSGEEGYEIFPAEKDTRGTEVIIHLREDAQEFASEWRLREIVKRHSDFVTFPIYIGEPEIDEESGEVIPLEPVNEQQAIWRRMPEDIEDEEYDKFYSALTMDFEPPALRIHTRGDAPLQFYALLYIPQSVERGIFSLRKEPGLKLYARKVLIQEYTTDLLPEYLQFVQGVVDSEDLPLNVSRETIQANPLVAKLNRVLTRRVLSELSDLAEDDFERFAAFWAEHGAFIKHGVVTDFANRERLLPLLHFYTSKSEDTLISLDQYVDDFVEGQESIYYIVADDAASASRSPHLDAFRARGIEVIYLTETVDGFLVTALTTYKDYPLVSVDEADLDLEGVGSQPVEEQAAEALPEQETGSLVDYMAGVLGDVVESVRVSKVLASGSPARLVAPKGTLDRHQQRIYQALEKEFEIPARILEINPRHPIIRNLSARLERGLDDASLRQQVNLLYQNAMLADGIHPNPVEMVEAIQALLEEATKVDDA